MIVKICIEKVIMNKNVFNYIKIKKMFNFKYFLFWKRRVNEN